MYTARFEFLPERASDFLPEGQLVTQMDFENIAEIVEYVQEFSDAIHSSLVFCQWTEQVVDLADFTFTDSPES